MQRVVGAGLALVLLAGSAAAQSTDETRPSRRVTLPALDAAALRAEDEAAAADGTRLRRVGRVRRFPTIRAPRRLRAGPRVVIAPDGSLVWTCEVHAKGAVGLRLRVRRCDLPPGAELTLRGAGVAAETHGPWTGRGPHGSGGFYTPTVFDERVRLELRVPSDVAEQPVRLVVDGVVHRYVEIAPEPDEDATAGDPQKVARCHRRLACEPAYAEIGRAVALLEFVDGRHAFTCSGILLEDADEATDIPWFLTAHHCISTEAAAQTVEAFWDYQAPCEGDPPDLRGLRRTGGAKLVVTHPGTDVTLLRLVGPVPGDRHFAPWSDVPLTPGASVASVHYPKGSHARISFGTVGMQSTNFDSVSWSLGSTQPGSSGGPLLNAQHEVVGQLYGGNAFCSFPAGTDEYGRLATSSSLLRDFIATLPPAPQPPDVDPFDPGDDEPLGAFESGQPGTAPEALVRRLAPEDRIDWFVFDLVRRGRYVFRSTGGEDVRAWLYDSPAADVPIASNDDGDGHLQFRIEHRPRSSSRVWLRVEAFPHGADRFYAVEAFTTTELARAPKKLRAQHRARDGRVLLRWKDKARGEAAYAVELYVGDAWQRIADLKRNRRRFAHKPGPGAGTHRYRVGPCNAAGHSWAEVEITIDAPAE